MNLIILKLFILFFWGAFASSIFSDEIMLKIPIKKVGNCPENADQCPASKYIYKNIYLPAKNVGVVIIDAQSEDILMGQLGSFIQNARHAGVSIMHAPMLNETYKSYIQYSYLRREIQDRMGTGYIGPGSPDHINQIQMNKFARQVFNYKAHHLYQYLRRFQFGDNKAQSKNYVYYPQLQHIPYPVGYKIPWNKQYSYDRTGFMRTSRKNALRIDSEIAPQLSDYVIGHYDEFRYLLWKHQIKFLLYAGGDLGICLLNREMGINAILGADAAEYQISVALLEDSVSTGIETPIHSPETIKSVMLDWFSYTKGSTTRADQLKFVRLKIKGGKLASQHRVKKD